MRRAWFAAGLTQEDLARKINYSNSHVSGIETGQRPPRSDYLAAIDKTLDTGGIFARMLAELVSTETTPAWLREWHAIERAATALRWYEPAFVPGLLQTEAYAREVLRMGGLLSEVGVEQRTVSRVERQAILKQDSPPQLIAVIDETVLRRPCRGPLSTMAEQLDHLAEMATLPHIYVHVVPLATPQYPGLQGGFIIAESAGESGGRVAYADDQLSAQIVDKPDDVANLAKTWEAIRAEALPPGAVTRPDQGGGEIMDLTGAKWRKSTRSGSNGGACVEVADNLPGIVLVRDTKDRDGGTLTFAPTPWRSFVTQLAQRP